MGKLRERPGSAVRKKKTTSDHLRTLDKHIARRGKKLTKLEKKEIFKTVVEVTN